MNENAQARNLGRLMIPQIAIVALLFSLQACGGQGGLSRSKAAKAIEERVNAKGDYPTVAVQVGDHYFSPESGEYRLDTVCFPLMEHGRNPAGYVPYTQPKGKWRNWQAAAEGGFITATAQEIRGVYLGMPYTAIKCTIRLTDKAEPFVKQKDGRDVVTLKAVERVDIKVTGLSKPGDLYGQTVSEAEFTYAFKFNPLGKALAEPTKSLTGSAPQEERPNQGRALFKLYDDGWRLEGSGGF